MSAFRLAISLADAAFCASDARFRHASRSGTIPDMESANAHEDQAMQAATKIAAPAFLIMQLLLRSIRAPRISVHSAVIPVAWIIRPHLSIDVFTNIALSASATELGS